MGIRIYLFLNDRLVSFTLPKNNVGSYTFDADPQEETKLINVESRNNKWIATRKYKQFINNM